MPQQNKETSNASPQADVRMRGFTGRKTVEEVWSWMDGVVRPLKPEAIGLGDCAGRVLAEPVVSNVDVPGFARSMMDGYALRASDTAGASAYNPLRLRVDGQVLPGEEYGETVCPGHAVRIMTGAAMPPGADAVLPVERTSADGDQVLIQGDVSPGKHVGLPGEDVSTGTPVLAAGRRLRAQDLGVLSSIGQSRVSCVAQPRVRIVVTGNELLPPGSSPHGCRIADANSPMLSALIRRDGGIPINPGIVPDDPEAILHAMQSEADVVLISGGSSVGQEDYAPTLLAEHGELAIHGVAMRPSSPVGMGRIARRLVFLLPGNPVSCLCAYDFFAGRAIRMLAGLPKGFPYRHVQGKLRRKLVSMVGRVDYARVRWTAGGVEPLAISGASILSSTTRADGFVVIPADSEGYPPDSEVTVWLYD